MTETIIPANAEGLSKTTPILTLFQKWDALYQAGFNPSPEDDEDLGVEQQRKHEREIMSLPVTCAADFAAKMIAFTSYGDFSLQEDGHHDLIAEGKSLIEAEMGEATC